MSTPSKKKQQ